MTFNSFPTFQAPGWSCPAIGRWTSAWSYPLSNSRTQEANLAVVFRAENIFNKQYTEIAGFESPGRSLLAVLK